MSAEKEKSGVSLLSSWPLVSLIGLVNHALLTKQLFRRSLNGQAGPEIIKQTIRSLLGL